jgi:PatG Domain
MSDQSSAGPEMSLPTPAHATTPPGGQHTCDCPSCAAARGSGASAQNFVYAIGRVETRFPRVSVEKELAQAIGRTDSASLTDRQVLAKVLKDRNNRYLARQLCWVFTIGNLENYILVPRDPADYGTLIDALRAAPEPADLDVVIGVGGQVAPPTLCNGLQVPIVAFDQIYSFDRQTLFKSIPRLDKTPDAEFNAVATELWDRIAQIADNSGGTDEHRALNYLLVRYPAVYTNLAEQHRQSSSLTGVAVNASPTNVGRKVMDVSFSFTHRQTAVVQKFAVRVDVTDEFPFLLTRLRPSYDR